MDNPQPPHKEMPSPVDEAHKNLVLLVYILQAAGFFIGVTFIAGLIVNYLKRRDVEGTWLASHFTWQIKTFWYAIAGFTLGFILMIILIGWLIMAATSLWVIYRIVKGWLAFYENRAIADGFF